MHEVTVNLDTLLWIAAGIGTFGAAAVYLKKWLNPLFRPFGVIFNRAAPLPYTDRQLSLRAKRALLVPINAYFSL